MRRLVSAAAVILTTAFGFSSARQQWWQWQRQQHALVSAVATAHGPVTEARSLALPHRPLRPQPAGFVALGDSYSAGIGTGFNGTENECRRGLYAHPRLIQARLSAAAHSSFQFLSCTGSTLDDILSGAEHSQVDALNVSLPADFALLSIGGNDLGFFHIINSCIFRFYSFYSGTCEQALARSQETLDGPEFGQRLRLAIAEILDRVQWEKRPLFTVFVTGYARFFNAETEECDEYSFGVWPGGPELKRTLRRRMNEMVLEVNRKISRSIDAVNAGFATPKVVFVDYDDAFEGHRFCEPNVTEPDYGRSDTWFFLVGGQDNFGVNESSPFSPAPRHSTMLPLASPLVDPDVCLGPARKSGDWGELALCMMAMAAKGDPSLKRRPGQVLAESSMWRVPTYYGKTFHPRTLGHMAIRDRIYNMWEGRRGSGE